jgi:hypothetical protein
MGQPRGATSFFASARHELLHVLGLGSAESWSNLVDESTDRFMGAQAQVANGGVRPALSADGAHFPATERSRLFRGIDRYITAG